MNEEILLDDGMEDANVNTDDNVQDEHNNIPSSDEKIKIPTMKVIPLKKICMTIGELPTSYLETMTYYEMLVWFIEYLKNNIIPTVNNNAEAVQEVQTIVMTLQGYINNYKETIDSEMDNFQEAVNKDIQELEDYMNDYFNNLDVQEEINNKLNQMLEDGVLTEIIQQFLQSTAIWCFDNVESMKQATNLINGSYARTLGYYSINDGGGSLYHITNTINSNNHQEILNNGLYANLIIDKNTSVNSFGAYGDDTHDDIQAFNKMINITGTIKTLKKTYLISDSLTINFDCNIDGTLHYTGNDYCININNCSHRKISINYIQSSTGGGILFAPENGNVVSFIDLYLKYAICNLETIKCDATNGIVTLIKFDGIRWRSSVNGLVTLNIDSTHSANTFLTEINIHNIDLWTQNDLKGIIATNNSSDAEIQFNLYNCNLENCKGISTTGKITMLGIYDCRMPEIVNVVGWLTFNNYLPKVVLHGNGYLYPQNILINGVSNVATGSNNYIETNMTIIDYTTTTNFEGGGILYYDHITPYIIKDAWKQIDIVDHYATVSQNKNGSIYNYFTVTTDAWSQITIPNGRILPQFVLRITNNYEVTITNGSNNKVFNKAGSYLVKQIGNAIFYTTLS